jgi:hypothetical protein
MLASVQTNRRVFKSFCKNRSNLDCNLQIRKKIRNREHFDYLKEHEFYQKSFAFASNDNEG